MFRFEKLNVWQRAPAFADSIYPHSGTFPVEERYGLTTQIRRAAVSISSNLAEGSARTDPDFAKFISYSTGSLYEVVPQLHVASRQGFIDETVFRLLYSESEEISRMLSGLRDSLDLP